MNSSKNHETNEFLKILFLFILWKHNVSNDGVMSYELIEVNSFKTLKSRTVLWII